MGRGEHGRSRVAARSAARAFDRSRAAAGPATRALHRSRVVGRWLARAFHRCRVVYLRIPLWLRLTLLALVVAGAGVAAVFLGWPIAPTVLWALLVVTYVGFALTRPSGAATVLVLLGWLFAVPLLALVAYEPAPTGGPEGRVVALLALLGLLVSVGVHLLRIVPPWRAALFALAGAGVLGSLAVAIVPAAGVVPAYLVALALLVYRLVGTRRAGTRARTRQVPPVEHALAELDSLVGLAPVKRHIHAIHAAIEAAWMRVEAGYGAEKPMRHFVFVGPPGTGKTSVARIVARIFYGFGLLDRPEVVEAQRSDLVSENVGGTALKTHQLVNSALGGVLFVDEAYSLVNAEGGQGDTFGAEAVQALLQRAENDREHLVIILAGYEREMDEFLVANPGLNSRFATRVPFPSYGSDELRQIAERHVASRGESLHPDAVPELQARFEEVCRRKLVDQLGNARFVRSLVESAAAARDLRIMHAARRPGREELVTILAADIQEGYAELTTRFQEYEETPSLREALDELDGMVGLEPVKRQVHGILAQLRVAQARRARGITTAPPMRHFVFTGPPGTGKTTVARILGRVFAALGLLSRPAVREAARVDLVAEHLGGTAAKTNKLVDGAVGGVLFIDEAYNLYNEGIQGGDAYGAEAIATLLKRAEDDRDKLVIVLAGYPEEMNALLARNQGLASRFTTHVRFPSYAPEELRALAELQAERGGDNWDETALADLDEIFTHIHREGLVDELGNGRFVRTLYEEAATARDMRLAGTGVPEAPAGEIAAAELTTLTSADVREAYEELAASDTRH